MIASLRSAVVLLLLWSSIIGPELLEDWGWYPAAAVEEPPSPKPKLPEARDLSKLARIAGGSPGIIDRDAFIAAFKRQAPTALLPCLLNWKPSPGSILVVAEMSRAGRLSHIAMVDSPDSLPACADDAMERMTFASIASLMPTDSHQVQWRIDW